MQGQQKPKAQQAKASLAQQLQNNINKPVIGAARMCLSFIQNNEFTEIKKAGLYNNSLSDGRLLSA